MLPVYKMVQGSTKLPRLFNQNNYSAGAVTILLNDKITTERASCYLNKCINTKQKKRILQMGINLQALTPRMREPIRSIIAFSIKRNTL